MSTFFHDIAQAALPVAIALLVLAAAARAVPVARIDDARVQRLAGRYLEPLSTWCLIALGVYTLALGAAGQSSLLAFVPPVALGVAAALLRPVGEEQEPRAPDADPEPRPTAPAPGSLWARQH